VYFFNLYFTRPVIKTTLASYINMLFTMFKYNVLNKIWTLISRHLREKHMFHFWNVGAIWPTLYSNCILVWFFFSILLTLSVPNTTCLVYTHMVGLEIHFVQLFDMISTFFAFWQLGAYYRSRHNVPEEVHQIQGIVQSRRTVHLPWLRLLDLQDVDDWLSQAMSVSTAAHVGQCKTVQTPSRHCYHVNCIHK